MIRVLYQTPDLARLCEFAACPRVGEHVKIPEGKYRVAAVLHLPRENGTICDVEVTLV